MIEWISCGTYLIAIEGKEHILKRIHFQWGKMTNPEDDSPHVYLHIEEGLNENIRGTAGTWRVIAEDCVEKVIYFHKEKPAFSLSYCTSEPSVTVKTRMAIDSVIRIGIQFGIMIALYRQCVGLHGVTLFCGREIIILSAPSGTGKTTLAKLLEKYSDAIIINGDFALISPTDEGVFFEPTPFCGSSGRCLNHRFRINRIVFLSQSKENEWRKLSGREAMVRFMSNAFVPTWNESMLNAIQGNILKCISMLEVNAYSFAPTQEAAEVFVNQITS